MAGYSGTPLAQKLGIKAGHRVGLIDAPEHFAGLLGELPEGVALVAGARGARDVVVAFFTERRRLERGLPALAKSIFPDGGVWIAWPKKASGVATDITEDVIRAVMPAELVDNKVCAVDDTWSGLRLVVRREFRGR